MDTDRLQKILLDSPVGAVLPAMAQLNLPDWWLAGGAVRNTVWRSLFGSECALKIKDFDLAFFDVESIGEAFLQENRAQEMAAKETLTAQFPDYLFDVKTKLALRAGVLVVDLITALKMASLIGCTRQRLSVCAVTLMDNGIFLPHMDLMIYFTALFVPPQRIHITPMQSVKPRRFWSSVPVCACPRARHQLTVKRLRHQPSRARPQKQARGCSLSIIRILAGIDDSP